MRRSHRHRNAGFSRQWRVFEIGTPDLSGRTRFLDHGKHGTKPARTNWSSAQSGVEEAHRVEMGRHHRPDGEAGEQGFLGWHERGYLPHFDAPNVTQFVTFLLRDAFPVTRRREWEPSCVKGMSPFANANWKLGSTVATASAGCNARMSPRRSNTCCAPKMVEPIA